MIKKETKEALIAATTVSPQTEINTAKSETKILVAPLLLYGAIAITVVTGIVSSAVYLGKPFQQYNFRVAESHVSTEPANSNTINTPNVDRTSTTTVNSVVTAIQESHTPEITLAEVQSDSENKAIFTEQKLHATIETAPTLPEKSKSLAQASAKASTAVANPIKKDSPRLNNEMLASHGYALVVEQNNQMLERLKQNQQRQINILRAQLSIQQSMIEQSIKQIETSFENRAASIKRHNENRRALYRRM